MTTLITGATGKTSIHLANLLTNSSHPILRTYHTRPLSNAVQFSWTDESTWSNPFAPTTSPPVKQMYLVGFVGVPKFEETVLRFVDFAIERGVTRVVVILGSTAEYGGINGGGIWKGLDEREKEGRLNGWGVLRPSWFMDNFLPDAIAPHHRTIMTENKIYSAMGDTPAPYVSTYDIARVAYSALTDPTPPNRDYHIVGPELLTHDQIAEILTKVLGRTITHVAQSPDERKTGLMVMGLPEMFAGHLVMLEAGSAERAEKGNHVVEDVTSVRPVGFEEWVRANEEIWKVAK